MNIIDLLQDHKIEFRVFGSHHHTSEGWIQVDCPQCSDKSGKFRLGINIQGGYCSCWCCGYMPMYRVLAQVCDVSYTQSYDWVREIPNSFEMRDFKRCGKKLEVPMDVGLLHYHHREYLRKRGFLPSQIVSFWDVSGIGQFGGQLKWRLYIPVLQDMEIVTWTTRSIADNLTPRYKNAKDEQSLVSINDCLYGIDHVRNACVVVEGPTDVWRIGPGAVALMGMNCSQSNIDKLSKIPVRVICFDAEEAAQARARKLADTLSIFPGRTVVVRLETGKDACSADRQEIESLRKEFLE